MKGRMNKQFEAAFEKFRDDRNASDKKDAESRALVKPKPWAIEGTPEPDSFWDRRDRQYFEAGWNAREQAMRDAIKIPDGLTITKDNERQTK